MMKQKLMQVVRERERDSCETHKHRERVSVAATRYHTFERVIMSKIDETRLYSSPTHTHTHTHTHTYLFVHYFTE